jgi:hypothetical protein
MHEMGQVKWCHFRRKHSLSTSDPVLNRTRFVSFVAIKNFSAETVKIATIMKLRISQVAFISVGLLLACWRIEAQVLKDAIHLKVTGVQGPDTDHALTSYEPIALKEGSLKIQESNEHLSLQNEFFDFDVKRDKNHLTEFDLRLEADSNQPLHFNPGKEVQHPFTPLSNSTTYSDLNGDSVLDTMIQRGPNKLSCFIMYHDTWVKVNNYMNGFASKTAYSRFNNTSYVFSPDGWEVKQ